MWRVSISILAAALLCICFAAGCSRTGKTAGDGEGLWKNTAAKEQLDPWLLVSDSLPGGEEAGNGPAVFRETGNPAVKPRKNSGIQQNYP